MGVLRLPARAVRSSLLRNAGIYTLANVLNASVPFLLMPILTRHLTPVDYGVVSMLQVLTGVLLPFMGLSTYGALSVRYYEKDQHRNLPIYIGSCFLIVICASAIVSIVVWVFSGPISRLTDFPANWLGAALVVNLCQAIIGILTTLWQCQVKPLKFGAFQVLQTLTNMSLSIVFVALLHLGWKGRIEAQVIAFSSFAVLALLILLRGGWVRLKHDPESVRHALRFGIPLIPHVLGNIIMIQTDRIFITQMSGLADTGIYTVGYQIGSILDFLAVSFNRAYFPWLFEKLSKNDPEDKKKIVSFTYAFFVGALVLAAGLSWFAPPFLQFFVGKDFTSASRYTQWIAFGFAFNAMYYMVTNYIFYAKKTHLLAWVTFLSAGLNIVLNYVLISRNGPIGAAQASAICFLIGFLLTWFLSAKVYPMPWFTGKSAVSLP